SHGRGWLCSRHCARGPRYQRRSTTQRSCALADSEPAREACGARSLAGDARARPMSANRAEPSLELGVIGNSVLSALIDARGRIFCCCEPRRDGHRIFCSLLGGARGAEAGFLDLEIDEFASTEQHYLS